MDPDAVLVATGSKSVVPRSIPGITGENVYTIEDILS
jgi:pyruvate/2-oxoglutarate dehydrogenase complex dihydrolipoamide dehydrogenase (E3) component